MSHSVSVRETVHTGSTGDRPTAPRGEGGESPTFIFSLTPAQVERIARFRMAHGFFDHSDPACTEISAVPTWSADLSTVEELSVGCSCGAASTFDPAGEEVIHG